VDQKNFEKKSEYEFSFYTFEENGILLSVYMASEYDYEAIWMFKGQIMYTFNAGSGNVVLKTTKTYNDGKWHKVRTTRDLRSGALYVNDQQMGSGETPVGASYVNKISKIYVGGIPEGNKRPNTISSKIGSIRGAIGGIKITPSPTSAVPEKYLVINAYGGGLADGVSIGEKGGFAEKRNSISVNTNFDISLDFRTRYRRGSLYSQTASDKNDAFSISIGEDGSVIATCNNGGGEFSVRVRSSDPSKTLCDGEFHNVKVSKRSRTLTVTLDGETDSYTTTTATTSADTKAPIFIGGVPTNLQSGNYQVFTGCIKDIIINKVALTLSDKVRMSGEAMRGCGVAGSKVF